MNRYLKVYNGTILEKTYQMDEFGYYEYYRTDKRQELSNIDTQKDKFVSALYRPIFYFDIKNMDSALYTELLAYEHIGCDFKLEIGAYIHDVVLGNQDKELYHPANTTTKVGLYFESIQTYNAPSVDTYSYIDSLYSLDKKIGLNGSMYINFYSSDLSKVYVYINAEVLVQYTQDDVVYSSIPCLNSIIYSSVPNGENVIKITGNDEISKIIIWGE